MAASYIPVLGADGNTYFFSITPIIVNGVTVYVQSAIASDPLSGLAASVTTPGNSGAAATAMQGVLGGVPINVTATPSGSSVANLSNVLVGASSTSIISAVNMTRVGFMLYNEGPSVLYFALAPTTIINPSGGGTYSDQLGVGDRAYVNTIPYYGVVSGSVAAGATPTWILVTELI